jgi:hypothetical protein
LAGQEALNEFMAHFQEENVKILKRALNDFVVDLRSTAAECNCKREI